MLNIYPPFVTR